MKVSNATHNHYMSAIRSILERLEDDEDIDYDINMCKKLKGLKIEPVRKITFLTDMQVEKLYNELLKNKKRYQMALFLALAYDSTGRRFEIMQVLKESFYDESLNNTNIVSKKGGGKDPLIYFSRTKEAAKIYLKNSGVDSNKSLWVTSKLETRTIASANTWCQNMSKILSEIEGVEISFTPHDLRHSAIENYTEGTHYLCPVKRIAYSVEDIQRLAGHANASMTQSYKKNKGLKNLENAFGVSIIT